jgi:SAM-dependent methyltransferase
MRQCAASAARAAGLADRVEIRAGRGEVLPVAEASVDVVIMNGVLSLTAEKLAVLREVRRVLRPGGRLYLADAALDRVPGFGPDHHPELWEAWIAGALMEDELPELAARAGLRRGRLVGCWDCFRNTEMAEALGGLRAHGVAFVAFR